MLDSHLKLVPCSGSCISVAIPCTPFVNRIEIYLCIQITSLYISVYRTWEMKTVTKRTVETIEVSDNHISKHVDSVSVWFVWLYENQ